MSDHEAPDDTAAAAALVMPTEDLKASTDLRIKYSLMQYGSHKCVLPAAFLYVHNKVIQLHLGRYTCFIATLMGNESSGDMYTIFYFKITSAPIGCASSKGLLITHPASPNWSGNYGDWHVKSHSKILTNFHWKFQKCEQELYNFVPIECFMKEQSVA
eukprot:sb/3473034/